jgi:hypothetical protein
MILDQTRYEAFWKNPEKYRLTYEVNLVPRALSYGLARGIALHTIAEEAAAGRSRADIDAVLKGDALTSRGTRLDVIDSRAVSKAWALWDEYERRYPLGWAELLASEQEFVYPIPGSPHSMAGRIDQVLRLNDGELWVADLKTSNDKARYDRLVEDWHGKPQAGFNIIGARTLGFDVQGMLVHVLVERIPPVIWELRVRRSEHALKLLELNVHQTAETIELYRSTFGIDQPWPHLPYSWPCSAGGAGNCEYEGICGIPTAALTESQLDSFKRREEHLGIIAAAKAEEVAA